MFNPFFAFYGGTLYSTAGALSALLGDRAMLAYTLVVAALRRGGLRGAGVARPPARGAHLDGARAGGLLRHQRLLRDGALRARGVVGVRRRLLAAAARRRRPARRPRASGSSSAPCFALWVAAVWWSGSHNITLAWGFAVFALLLVALFLARVRLRSWAASPSWSGWACPSTPGSWSPTWLYASQTMISAVSEFAWGATRDFNTPYALFDPLRHVPLTSGNPALYVQAPVWLLRLGAGGDRPPARAHAVGLAARDRRRRDRARRPAGADPRRGAVDLRPGDAADDPDAVPPQHLRGAAGRRAADRGRARRRGGGRAGAARRAGRRASRSASGSASGSCGCRRPTRRRTTTTSATRSSRTPSRRARGTTRAPTWTGPRRSSPPPAAATSTSTRRRWAATASRSPSRRHRARAVHVQLRREPEARAAGRARARRARRGRLRGPAPPGGRADRARARDARGHGSGADARADRVRARACSPASCSSASPRHGDAKPEDGFEPTTYRLQGGCSGQLSYSGGNAQCRRVRESS